MSGPIKLDFANIRISGRKEELAALSKAFDKVSATPNPVATAVFIEGSSGSGKTSLIEAFCESISDRCLFCCRGKFEEQSTASEPFSAIARAMNELVDKLIQSSEKETWKMRIKQECKEDLPLLETFVPRLKDFFKNDEDSKCEVAEKAVELGEAKNLGFEWLQFALRNFIRLISRSHQLLIFMDDLQWAARESLALIETLLVDTKPGRRLLFVGAHRPVERSHVLLDLKNHIQEDKLMCIRLCELGADSVGHIMSNLLRRDKEEVSELAEIIYRKTGGNAFFVVQFIGLLEQRGLLNYSFKNYRWEWDAERIKSETVVVSNSVVDLVVDKIRKLAGDQQTLLMQLACLGVSQFDVETVRNVLLSMSIDMPARLSPTSIQGNELDSSEKNGKLSGLLNMIADEGFLEKISSKLFNLTMTEYEKRPTRYFPTTHPD